MVWSGAKASSMRAHARLVAPAYPRAKSDPARVASEGVLPCEPAKRERRHALVRVGYAPGTQYLIFSRSSVGWAANAKLASLKLGGPMKPLAWFDATKPSVGMPNRVVSSALFPFSS